jgi:hypothetical protein
MNFKKMCYSKKDQNYSTFGHRQDFIPQLFRKRGSNGDMMNFWSTQKKIEFLILIPS